MRASLSANVLLMAIAGTAAAAFIYGCGSSDAGSGGAPSFTAGAAGAPASAGAPAGGAVGTAGAATGGAAGAVVGGGGAAPTAGAAGTAPAGGAAGASTGGGAGGASGGSGGAAPTDITAVVKTAGCGMIPPGAFQPGKTSASQTIMTMGTKPSSCADSNCAAWSYNREYFVTLPANYDNTKAYPLVFEGPGCGGKGTDVYPLTGPDAGSAANVNNTVIRVGLTPPPNAIGHATNPNQGCFDDKEGDSSVDWVFYENLWDKLAGQVCFDKNRVFASGNSSGAWFSNEVGCKYAGDATHPIRGIMPNTGGLPTDAKFVPTCTTKPMAGMWVGETNDPDNPFAGNVVGINRAIAVNKCTGGDWPNSPTVDYPVTGKNMVCKKLTGCPDLYPLVVCLINGNSHASHDDITNPGFSKFITGLEAK